MTNTWTRETLAWLAGLLEGEGSFLFKKNNNLTIKLAMTDQDIVQRAAAIAGFGSVSGPYQYNIRKPFWVWTVGAQHEAYALMVALYQWMGTRRKWQIANAIKAWRAWQARCHKHTRLSPAQVAEIREAYRTGPAKGEVNRMAEKFGVHRGAVYRAGTGRTHQ